jgi:plastocyanin
VKRTLAAVAVVLLAGCSSGSTTQATTEVTAAGAADAQTATVGMTDRLTFKPNVVKAKVGTLTLTTTNEGNTPHNLTFQASGLGKTPTVSGKESKDLKLVFDKAGTFTFSCTFHEGMTGTVIVTAAGS